MTKRIKRVFSTADQVLHIWANQSQDSARCSNVFFEGNKVYSYGYHYELGRIVTHKGKKVALINDKGYSVTTSGHISSAIHAASHLIVVCSPELDVIKGMKHERQDLVDAFAQLLRRKKYWSSETGFKSLYISEQIDSFNSKCKALKLSKLQFKPTKTQINAVNEHIKARIKREVELKALRTNPEYQSELQAKREAKFAREIPNWRAGGKLTNQVRNLNPQIIRVKGDTVETSRGANVPLSHALRLLRIVDAGEAKQGERIGHFTLSSVAADTVRIGCHTISIAEARAVLAPYSMTLIQGGAA